MKTNTPKWWFLQRGLLLLIGHAVEGRVTPLPAARVLLDADASGAFAHGFRRLALTAGQEVLKVDHEIIQRPMAHTFGDKIRCSYDKSQMMDERRDFMVACSDALLEQSLIT